jgi:hypothetical protein
MYDSSHKRSGERHGFRVGLATTAGMGAGLCPGTTSPAGVAKLSERFSAEKSGRRVRVPEQRPRFSCAGRLRTSQEDSLPVDCLPVGCASPWAASPWKSGASAPRKRFGCTAGFSPCQPPTSMKGIFSASRQDRSLEWFWEGQDFHFVPIRTPQALRRQPPRACARAQSACCLPPPPACSPGNS